MPRLMFVARTQSEREALLDRLKDLDPQHLHRRDTVGLTLGAFRANPNGILVCHPNFALMGFSVPADTVILLGPGFKPTEQTQMYARPRAS